MEDKIKGIALLLFGILLSCAQDGLNDTIFVSRCLTFSGGGATISCGGCRADKTSWSFCSVLVRVKM